MTRELWRTILVPHDFSTSANLAAAIARDEARAHGGKLLLLHVVDLPLDLGPDTTLIVGHESAGPISMRHFAMSGAEAHLRDLAERLARDSVTERVVRTATVPVMTIRHPD